MSDALVPASRRARATSWGLAVGSEADVFLARSVDDVRAVFDAARRDGRTICLRGAGCSYGDAALNGGGVILDVARMNRILAFDPATGVATVEPGVTIRDLWMRGIPHGYWPAVVPGTMNATIGGSLAMNIHGKNSYAVGTIGEHVLEATLLTPAGEEIVVSRTQRPDLFHAVVGGFGMFGCFTRITIRMKHVPGGRVRVRGFAPRTLADMIAIFEREKADADYLVGWIDGFASGRELGRGVVHRADYAGPEEDPLARETLAVEAQHLPARFMGFIPRSMMRYLLRPFVNDLGMRCINRAKHWSSVREERGGPRLQSHAAFAFLLDYIPEYRRAFGRGGVIQYQSFVPADRALDVHAALIRRAQEAGLPPYLLVYKRHRKDDWGLTHSVDGFSLAMDFRITDWNRRRVWDLCQSFDDVVIAAGGRFYFAKDATLTRASAERAFPAADLAAFRALKAECDPGNLLQSELYRRLFA